jgi:hypothetical protein
MKKVILMLFCIVNFIVVAQIPISPKFFAQNYWMPNKGPFTGHMQTYWSNIVQSGVKYMRVGGIDYDGPNMWSNTDIIDIIDEIRLYNIEPIIQVPIDNNKTIGDNVNDAVALITAINSNAGRNIMYWEIGNEPNAEYSSGTYDYSTTSQIKSYITQISTAMKGVSGQSGIKIIGPALTHYDYNLYEDLMDGGVDDITGSGPNGFYIDYISFHTYPFNKSKFQLTTARQDVIEYIETPSKFRDALTDINSLIPISRVNNLKVMITETNIGYQQDNSSSATKGPHGVGPGSFLGGQFWAEMMAVAMEKKVETVAFWSVIEGTSSNNRLTDIGYISSETHKERSSYHHYSLIANNFSGDFLPNLITTNAVEFKAFGYINASEIGVLIMNQKETFPIGSGYSNSFSIQLDQAGTTNSKDIQIKLDAGVTGFTAFDCVIKTESTVLYKFDLSGNLLSKTEYNIEDAEQNVGPKTQLEPIGADAYIRDTPADDGEEPNPADPWHLVNGTDVWVRNTAETPFTSFPKRFPNEHIHESPIFSSSWANVESSRPVIYVKVRNRGCASISGNVRVFHHSASATNDLWDADWTEIFDGDSDGNGAVISPEVPGTAHNISLLPGEEGVVAIRWQNTAGFTDPGLGNEYPRCLVAKFDAFNDPVVETFGISAGWSAKESNNFTQKNLVITSGGQRCYWMAFSNATSTNTTTNRLDIVDNSEVKFYSRGNGKMKLNLDSTLYAAWTAGGNQGYGITYGAMKYSHRDRNGTNHFHSFPNGDPDPYQIIITSDSASLMGIPLNVTELRYICNSMIFHPTSDNGSLHRISYRQYETDSTEVFSGAVNYHIPTPECNQVSTSQSFTLYATCESTLEAFPDLQDAQYTWRNNTTGATIAQTSTLHVNPSETTWYEIEMLESNGCLSYAFVNVTRDTTDLPCSSERKMNVVSNDIQSHKEIEFNAFPNPFDDNLTITYFLPDGVKEGSLKIYEAASGKTVYSTVLDGKINKLEINNFKIGPGLYICNIQASDGSSKQFKLVKVN